MDKNIDKPVLRFSEFSDSWRNTLLEEVCKIKTGNKDTKDRKEDGKYPFFVRSNNVERINSYSYDGEAILTSGDGVGVGKNFHYMNGKFDYHQRVYALKDFKEDYSAKFIYQVFSQKFYRRVLSLSAKNSVDSVRMDFIAKMKIGIPSFQEQQKIAFFLSSVDKKTTLLQQKKTLLETYKKGVMQKIFSQGLRFKPDLSEVEDDDYGNSYPDWEEKRLGEIGTTVTGLTYSPNDINESGVLVLRSSNVQDRILTFEDNVYVNVKEGKYNPVKENDILICVRNGSKRLIGKNAIINKEREGLAFGAFMAIYRSTYNKFLFHFFDSDIYKKQVHRNLGATINSINGSDLKKFKVPFPSIEEQTQIANFLSVIDDKIQLVNTQIEKTKAFKKGLLQQMFV